MIVVNSKLTPLFGESSGHLLVCEKPEKEENIGRDKLV